MIISSEYPTTPPSLIVEILSTSTRHKDLGLKLELYQSFGVPYYFMADPDEKVVQRYQLVKGDYSKLNGQRIQLEDGKIRVDFEGVF